MAITSPGLAMSDEREENFCAGDARRLRVASTTENRVHKSDEGERKTKKYVEIII